MTTASSRGADQGQLYLALQKHLAVMDLLFADPGLDRLRRRNREHPAVRDYDQLRLLANRAHEIDYGRLDETAQALARMFLDLGTWVSGPVNEEFLERTIPDEAARRMVLSRVPLAESFDDVMAELFCWGWMRGLGWDVVLSEAEGLPDLHVRHPFEMFAEVKRIHVGTNVTRVRKHVNKANKQLRRTGHGRAGVVYMFVDREPGRAALDDRVPNDVMPYLLEAQAVLQSESNSSVAAIVVIYDQVFMQVGGFPPSMVVSLSRLPVVVTRTNAQAELPEGASRGPSFTAELGLNVRPARPTRQQEVDVAGVRVNKLFRHLNETGYGIRPAQAIEVIKEPDASAVLGLHTDLDVQIMTRLAEVNGVRSLILVLTEETPDVVELLNAFQLTGDEDVLQALAKEPLMAFNELLGRFAIRIEVGVDQGTLLTNAQVHDRVDVRELDAATEVVSHVFVRPRAGTEVLYSTSQALQSTLPDIATVWG